MTEDEVITVYGKLMVKHHHAARAGDEPLRKRVFAAIDLFEELWPMESKIWRDMFASGEQER